MPAAPAPAPAPAPASGPAAPARSWGRELAWSVTLGLLAPILSVPFVGLGGGAGYLVALVLLALGAVASRPSVVRFLGVLAGALSMLAVLFMLLSYALRDI